MFTFGIPRTRILRSLQRSSTESFEAVAMVTIDDVHCHGITRGSATGTICTEFPNLNPSILIIR